MIFRKDKNMFFISEKTENDKKNLINYKLLCFRKSKWFIFQSDAETFCLNPLTHIRQPAVVLFLFQAEPSCKLPWYLFRQIFCAQGGGTLLGWGGRQKTALIVRSHNSECGLCDCGLWSKESHTLQQNFKSRITQNCNFPMLLHDKMCLPNANYHIKRYYSPGSRCAEWIGDGNDHRST